MTESDKKKIVRLEQLDTFRDEENNILRAQLAMSMLTPALTNADLATMSVEDNPEFYTCIVDAEEKIIAGVTKDWRYIGLPLGEAMDAIISLIENVNQE